MKNMILVGGLLISFMPLQAMDSQVLEQQEVNLSSVQEIFEKWRIRDRKLALSRFTKMVKQYAEDPTVALQEFLLTQYDAEVNLQEDFERILKEKLDKGIHAVRGDRPGQDGELLWEVDARREAHTISVIMTLVQNYAPGSNQLILHLRDQLVRPDYRNQADRYLSDFYRKRPTFNGLVLLLDGGGYALSQLEEEVNKIESGDERTFAAGFLIQHSTGMRLDEIKRVRAHGRAPRRNLVEVAHGGILFIRPKGNSGVLVFNSQQANCSKFIKDEAANGKGTLRKNPIEVPLSREELTHLRDEYIKGYLRDAGATFEFVTMSQLTFEKLATAIKHFELLQMGDLLELFLKKLSEKTLIDRRAFEEIRDELENFAFSAEIQAQMSNLLFTREREKKLLSHLYSILSNDLKVKGFCAGPLGYFITFHDKDLHLWNSATAGSMKLTTVDSPIVAIAFCNTPFIAVLCEESLALIDIMENTAHCITLDGSFESMAVSPNGSVIALGSPAELVLITVADLMMKQLHQEEEPQEACPRLMFAADGRTLIEARNDVRRLWDIISEEQTTRAVYLVQTLDGHWCPVASEWRPSDAEDVIFIDSRGRRVLVRENGAYKVVDLKTRREVWVLRHGKVVKACFSSLDKVALLFVPERDDIVPDEGGNNNNATDDKPVVILFDLAEGVDDNKRIAELASHAEDVFFTSDGKHLITRHNSLLRQWYCCDHRVEYLKRPEVMTDALLYAHCLHALEDNPELITSIAHKLVQGKKVGLKALSSLVLGENDSDSEMEELSVSAVEKKDVHILYADALAAYNKSDYERACVVVESIFSKDPYHTGALSLKGEMKRQGRGYEKSEKDAIALFKKIADRPKDE